MLQVCREAVNDLSTPVFPFLTNQNVPSDLPIQEHQLDAESRSTPNGTLYTRFSLAMSVSWKEKGSNEYKTRTEWHRVISWNKLAEWAGTLQKGAYVEIEGELRHRDNTPAEADRSVRVAEIHAASILAPDRSDRQPVSAAESEPADEPLD